MESLWKALETLPSADLFICSHPTAFCLLSFWLLRQPMLLHMSSTLLYGAPQDIQDFLGLARELITGPLPLVTLAEAEDKWRSKRMIQYNRSDLVNKVNIN